MRGQKDMVSTYGRITSRKGGNVADRKTEALTKTTLLRMFWMETANLAMPGCALNAYRDVRDQLRRIKKLLGYQPMGNL